MPGEQTAPAAAVLQDSAGMMRQFFQSSEAARRAASSLKKAASVGVRFTDVPGEFRFHAEGGEPRFETGRADDPDFELTLIEAEAVEALARDYGLQLEPGNARRNLVTRGVALNHLVGREFKIGDVLIRGIRLCEPCEQLQRVTGKQLIKGLRHRGGLRAQILTEGTIHMGDLVKAAQ